jgi:hypothetical protein
MAFVELSSRLARARSCRCRLCLVQYAGLQRHCSRPASTFNAAIKVGPTSHAGYSRTAKLAKPCGSLVSEDDSEDRDTFPISLPTWHSRGCQVRSRLRSFIEWGPPKPSLPYRSAAGVFKNLWNQFYTHLCRKAEAVPLQDFSVPYWESLTWHSMDNLSFK